MAEQTETPKRAAIRFIPRPGHHLVNAFLDDDLDRRLSALSPARSLAGTPEFRAVVDGLVAALGSMNPTFAHRALVAMASLGPPAVPHLLDHLEAGVSSLAHSRLVTALAVAGLHADTETRPAVRAVLASVAGEENPPSPLWLACSAALAWLDARRVGSEAAHDARPSMKDTPLWRQILHS